MDVLFKANCIVMLVWSLCGLVSASPLPFLETFETAHGVTNGTIDGQNGWVLDGGTGEVQSDVWQAGSQALEIQNGRVAHDLSSDGSALWLHFQARCAAAPSANALGADANTTLAFFVNTNLNLVVYSNTVPVELNAQMQINVWTRFDIYCDYDDLYWDLAMNGTNVAAGLPLYSTNSKLGSVEFGNESTSPVYIDEISLADEEQTAGGLPDTDDDDIPDWWEQKYFGGATSVVAGDPSGNEGLTYLQTYIAGVSPFVFDPFAVFPVDGGNGLGWTPVQSRLYSVYWTQNLTNAFTLLQADIPYPQAEFIDGIHGEDSSGFYRLQVQVAQ